jgi:type I restriction enzyme S subunit
MQQLFTSGLRGKAQKETEIGHVPFDWEVDHLGAHHTVVSGGTPSRGNPAFWIGGTIPWAKTTEVNYCVINKTGEHITQEGLAASAAKLLPAGTLLLAMYGQGVTRGRIAILGIEATCNQACAAITPKNGTVSPKFLYHFLAWRYEAIRELAHGGQQQNLNLDIVRDLNIAYPTDPIEQQEIIEILDALDQKIELHKNKKSVLDELFRSLLNKLMTGELSVNDLDLSALTADETQTQIEAKVQS